MKLNQRRLLTDYFTSLKGGNTCVIHGRTWMFHVSTALNMHKQPGCSENSKYAEYVNNSSHEERGSLQDPHPHGIYWGGGYMCMLLKTPKRKIPSLSSKHVSQLTNEWKQIKKTSPLRIIHSFAKVTNEISALKH